MRKRMQVLVLMLAVFAVAGIEAARAGFGSVEGLVGFKGSAKAGEDGFYTEADFLYNLNSVVALGPGVGFSSYKGLDDVGDFMMLPVLMKMRISTPTQKVKLFAEGGIGYYLMDFQLSPAIASELAAYGVSADAKVESTTGNSFGGGVRFQIGQSTVMGLSVHRHNVKPKATLTFSGFGESLSFTGTSDQSSTVYGLNVSVRF